MSIVRAVVLVLGALYVVAGALGFVGEPFATDAGRADTQSAGGNLLGIFPINALHNLVHVLTGAALLVGATAHERALPVARIVGGLYAVIGLLGFVSPDGFGLMPIGGPDIVLHLVTAVILLGTSLTAPGRAARAV